MSENMNSEENGHEAVSMSCKGRLITKQIRLKKLEHEHQAENTKRKVTWAQLSVKLDTKTTLQWIAKAVFRCV